MSWVKTHAYELGVTSSRTQDPLVTRRGVDVASGEDTSKIDIHLHLPAGAQKKDGPSAGIAMVSSLVSSLSLKPSRSYLYRFLDMRLRITIDGCLCTAQFRDDRRGEYFKHPWAIVSLH